MYSHEEPLATVSVGSLRIDVWYCEDRRHNDDGTRRAYGYRIADNDPAHPAYEAPPSSRRLDPASMSTPPCPR